MLHMNISKLHVSALINKIAYLLLSISFFTISSASAAPWKEVQVGYGGEPVKITTNNDKIYIGQFNNRMDLHPRTLISSDSGASWYQIPNPDSLDVCNIVFDNNNQIIYFSKYSNFEGMPTGVYKTTDNFKHITPLYHGDNRDQNFSDNCPQFVVLRDRLLVSSAGKIDYSFDQGNTFEQATLPDDLNKATDVDITNLLENSDGVLVATTGTGPIDGNYGSVNPKGIFYSTDQGKTWQQSDAPTNNRYQTQSAVVVGKTFYSLAKTSNGNSIFQSTDGKAWTENTIPNQIKPYMLMKYYMPLAVDEENRIYISSQQGVWMKSKNEDWQLILDAPKAYRNFFINKNGELLDTEWGGVVRKYSPQTEQWTTLDGIPSSVRGPMLSTPDAAYIQAVSGLYKLSNTDSDWKQLPSFASQQGVGYTLSYSKSDDSIYAGLASCYTYKSTDGGHEFNQILSSLTDTCYNDSGIGTPITRALLHNEGRTLLSVTDVKTGLFASDDDEYADYIYGINLAPYQLIHATGDTIYAAFGYQGVFQSLDNGHTWFPFNQQLPYDDEIKHIAFDPNTNLLFAAGTNLYQRNLASDQWQTIGYGLPWDYKHQHPAINDILINKGQIYVTREDFGVYSKPLSTGNGHWTAVNDGLTSKKVGRLIQFNNKLYVNDDDNIFEYPLP